MFIRKLLDRLLVVLLLASLVLTGSAPVLAQDPGPGNQQKYQEKAANWQQKKDQRITPADRQAAATTSGLTLDTMAAAEPVIDPNTGAQVPRYFSHPNYANSPLRMPDAMVGFVGDGTGAVGSAIVDPLTGAITGVTLDAGGSGYSAAPDVVFSGSGSGASATATISGTVSALTLDSSGSGYTGPVSVEISGDGVGAVATATLESSGFVSAVTVTNPGSGYTNATVTITGDGSGAV